MKYYICPNCCYDGLDDPHMERNLMHLIIFVHVVILSMGIVRITK